MEKFSRNERIGIILKTLTDNPLKVFTLGIFTEMFKAAKSTISEDIDIVQSLMERFSLGIIETLPGASGGVRYIPVLPEPKIHEIILSIANQLSSSDRILPGGFVYMLDVIYNPQKIEQIGKVFATKFFGKGIDYVITVETKGIPIAYSTARHLNVPLVIVRHYSEATDGASVNINYVSGTSNKMQTMVLSLKALKKNSKLLFIDDFMKGGGTAKGIVELAKEFDCDVVGIGVFMETAQPEKKLINDYYSLITLNSVDSELGKIDLRPSIN